VSTDFFLTLPAILFGLTIHEYAHGYVAYRLGDPTAKLAGRLTLNPLKHLDLMGTLAVLIFRIGWAKPVPIDPYYFKNIKRDTILVSLAGPLSNFSLAFLSGLILQLVTPNLPTNSFFVLILRDFVLYNLIFCAFNSLPIPPLDGSKVLSYILSDKASLYYMQLERYGFFILLFIIFIGQLFGAPLLWWVIGPFVNFFSKLFAGFSML